MIEEDKLSLENQLLLLKHIGYHNVLNDVFISNPSVSLLIERFEKMIINEEKRKENRNEMLLADICECYLFLSNGFVSNDFVSIFVRCILNAASNKDEKEKTQKDVEIALLALSNIDFYNKIESCMYLDKIAKIILHHQVNRNLTRLANQAAWEFLMKRLKHDESLEDMIVNVLHFAREATRELKELSKFVNWKRKVEENGEKGEKVVKELLIIAKWLSTKEHCLSSCSLWNEEYIELEGCVSGIFLAAIDNYEEICSLCICSFRGAADNRSAKIEDILKGGAVDVAFEGIKRPTLNDLILCECLRFFHSISRRIKRKEKNEMEEVERNATKMKIIEKMEEEGYECIIFTFVEIIPFLNGKKYNYFPLSLDVSDYLVNA